MTEVPPSGELRALGNEQRATSNVSNEQYIALIGSLYGLTAWLLKPPYKPICRMPVWLSKNVKHL
jgi:hypothetical protein